MAKIFFEKKGFWDKQTVAYETQLIYSIVQTQNFASQSAQRIAPIQSFSSYRIVQWRDSTETSQALIP
jgi:hypothetical protein